MRTDIGTQVFPLRILRIGRGPNRIRPNVAEPARHSNAIRPNQILGFVVGGVGVIPDGIPFLLGGLIEVRVRKHTKSDDAGRVPVERADRQIFPARTRFHARVLLLVLERVRRAVRAALIEPEVVALRVRTGRLDVAGLVDEPEVVPAVVKEKFGRQCRRKRA